MTVIFCCFTLFVCLFVTMLPLEFLDKFCFLECWDILPKVFANIWGIGDRMKFRPTGWISWENWFKNWVLHGLCYTTMTSIRATRGLNWNMECWGWNKWIYFLHFLKFSLFKYTRDLLSTNFFIDIGSLCLAWWIESL